MQTKMAILDTRTEDSLLRRGKLAGWSWGNSIRRGDLKTGAFSIFWRPRGWGIEGVHNWGIRIRRIAKCQNLF